MRHFDVQGVHIRAPRARAFAFIADPTKLPRWAEAFESVDGVRAILRTPQGNAKIGLRVDASPDQGTVDWRMTFPDGTIARAYSRLVELDESGCVFTFVLTPPPVPLEAVEGALEAQSRTLAKELQTLKEVLESNAGC